jgi:hypothetical protein
MIVDTLLEQLGGTSRIAAFDTAQETDHGFAYESLQSECWMDDLLEVDHGPEDETLDEEWMEDLDEAA